LISANFSDYVKEVQRLAELAMLDVRVQELVLTIKSNSEGKILIVGNGGSSSIAEHFVTDLSRAKNLSGNYVRALYLASNTSLLTADANDFGYSNIFARQVTALANSCDILVAISSSGNSPNVISAILEAKRLGIKTYAFTGFDGGEAHKICDVPIHVPSEIGLYEQVEDVHAMICHFVAMQLKKKDFIEGN
jgi:D-sedoheptulose 7-phosphate isomerase